MTKISLHKLSKGPKVKVTFALKDSVILKISLSMSSYFCCEFENEEPSLLREKILTWLNAYSKKEKSLPELPLRLDSFTDFQKNVLKEMQKIPLGEVLSYQELATKALCPRGARAIGNVCRGNLFPLIIPCHRVIKQNGFIGGFALNLGIKEELLNFEGFCF